MSDNLNDVIKITQSILGDPQGDVFSVAYLTPIINHIYKLQILYLSETCSPYVTELRTIINVPAGTTTLAPYQQGRSSPLYGLFNPFTEWMDFKMTGQPEMYYRHAKRTRILPDVNINSPSAVSPQSGLSWEWRSWVLYVTPIIFPIDIRVRGEFIPPPLLKLDDIVTVHPMLADVLAEESAACAMRERANAGQMQAYELGATGPLDNISNQLVRSEQGNIVRIGRATGPRQGARSWGGWASWGQ